ncbi:MAG: TIGR03067 domain-containing protein, partial [Armatimonadetes bacterium]|nr:TIGR03067 domain-containing protein [Armatimonadota bacterium]
MSDKDDLQGLWKIESMMHRGQTVGYSTTHWEFDGDRVLELIPNYVDGGTWATFTLDETANPKRMEQAYTFPTDDGGTRTQSHKQCYELSGDTLTVGGAVVYGDYPPEISDAVST